MEKLPYGYCGMPCALCTRYRATGTSRCPGCSKDGYFTEPCKIYHCCKNRNTAHCGLCREYPCKKTNKIEDFSDLSTNHSWEQNCEVISKIGFEAWLKEYETLDNLLTIALKRYNNGRMKRFCVSFLSSRILRFYRVLCNKPIILSEIKKNQGKGFKKS